MKTSENQKSTNHQPAAQKPFFGAGPEHAFFSPERAPSPPFFQPQAISPSTIQAKSTTSEAEGITQPLVQRIPAFESEIMANGEVQRKEINSPSLGEEQSVQRMGEEEDETPVMPKLDTVQRMGEEEEEMPVMPKLDTVQRMGEEEDETPVMPKLESVQRMGEEEEDMPVMPKLDTVQRKGHGGGEATGDLSSAIANNSPQAKQAAQLQVIAANHPTQQQQPSQKKASPEPGVRENNTGLPDNLKSGIENLSGYSMDDVKVHYNSDKPAQLQALAYTQGTEIHVAPGQEKHLPHETWHVVQQMQGRVKPTMQAQGMAINDNPALEREADMMGVKAACVNRPDSFANEASQKKSNSESTFQFVDNQPEAIAQRKLQALANNSPRVTQLKMVIQLAKTGDGDEIPGFLYHATTAEAATAIMEEGLGGVSVSKSRLTGKVVRIPRTIWLIGNSSQAAGSGEGAVLKINTAGMDLSKLRNRKRIDPLYPSKNVWIYTGIIAPEYLEQL